MEKQNLQNKYPLFTIEIKKNKCLKKNIFEILTFLKDKIEQHPIAHFIGVFDHYSHTKKLKEGEINSVILDAQIILFCFGEKLETPLQLAARPRAIGISESKASFTISFLDAPNPLFNVVMEKWIKSLIVGDR